MQDSAYWVAACQDVTCGWEMVTGTKAAAEESRETHEAAHPDHWVEIVAPAAQGHYWLIPPA